VRLQIALKGIVEGKVVIFPLILLALGDRDGNRQPVGPPRPFFRAVDIGNNSVRPCCPQYTPPNGSARTRLPVAVCGKRRTFKNIINFYRCRGVRCWGPAMWPFDFPTLILILAAGLELGAQGALGVSLYGWLFGSWKMAAYQITGLAAVWQICRQRFQ